MRIVRANSGYFNSIQTFNLPNPCNLKIVMASAVSAVLLFLTTTPIVRPGKWSSASHPVFAKSTPGVPASSFACVANNFYIICLAAVFSCTNSSNSLFWTRTCFACVAVGHVTTITATTGATCCHISVVATPPRGTSVEYCTSAVATVSTIVGVHFFSVTTAQHYVLIVVTSVSRWRLPATFISCLTFRKPRSWHACKTGLSEVNCTFAPRHVK